MIKTPLIWAAIFVLTVIVGGLTVINQPKTPRAEATIFPLEGIILEEDDFSLAERQRVDLYLREPSTLETLIISNIALSLDPSDAWKTKDKDNENLLISKSGEGQLYIGYEDNIVFSTNDLTYDYISFNTVCTGKDKRQRLLFTLIRGGTANGDMEDMLFLYIDPISNNFQHKIIERRYLPDVCDMEAAQANEAEGDSLLKAINSIHEKLRPSIDDTDLDKYLTSSTVLPTRQFSNTQLELILTEFKKFIPVEIESTDEIISADGDIEYEYPNFYEPEVVISDLAQNDNWRIIQVLYLQLYASWGVLLAENKSTGEWTSFYTITEGDSKQHLYFDNEVQLTDEELRGKFNPYSLERVAISLQDFTVNKTFDYYFAEYPIESIYDGPIAELDTKSSELAGIFTTRIRNQLKEGVNFAGHYSIMMAGCGTECQMITITDVVTGKVVAETSSRAGAEYREESNLLIIDSDEICLSTDICIPRYYVMHLGKLIGLD